jgi:5-methylcytosine-specific restriction enzyme A
MPQRPKTHSERLREQHVTRVHNDYERRVRLQDQQLLRAKRIRSSARWQHLRVLKLAKNPLCENPYGTHATFEPAIEVDHILPIRLYSDKAFDLNNLQSLCGPCHARKSGCERALYKRGVL